jgi:hypothetical protein
MIGLLLLTAFQSPIEWRPTAKFTAPALSEVSGIAKSGTHSDIFWVHNDSGDSARIFAVRANGSMVREFKIQGAKNVDWEDMAFAEGSLAIADLGNNGNARKNLGVYFITEPNPRVGDTVYRTQFVPVVYPDQASFPPTFMRFDCEAVFWFKGKLHVLTKHRLPGGLLPESSTNLYRLDTRSESKPNRLKKLDSKEDMKGWVTAADMSPDGRYLAVLTHMPRASVWIFDTEGVGDKLLSKPVRWVELRNAKQCEAICWVGKDELMIANEQRELFVVKLSQLPKL